MTDSQKDEKPKKDWWDKIEIIGKGVIAIAALVVIPIIVARISGQVQKTITSQNTGKDYITIALGILERKDLPEDMQKNSGLRQWAVRLLNHYSPERLDDHTIQELIRGETRIPGISRLPTISEIEASPFFSVVEFSKDKRLRVEVYNAGIFEIIDMTTGHSRGGNTISFPKDVVFSPDNHHFAIYNDVAVQIFDVDMAKNSVIQSGVRPRPSGVKSVAFTDDSVVVTDRDGKEIKRTLRDLERGLEPPQ